VTRGLIAARYEQYAAIFDPLDLTVEDSKLRWITLVVSGVDRKEPCLDPLQP
jgi:hypothetical protein